MESCTGWRRRFPRRARRSPHALDHINCGHAGLVRPIFSQTQSRTHPLTQNCSYIFLTGLSGGFDATQNQATGLTSIAFLFLTFGFYDIAWTPLSYSYTVELLPYSLRAKGMSLFIWSQQASLVCACTFSG